jgi:hypothetical protein
VSRFRDFDAGRAEATGEPVVFKVEGQEFSLPPELPAIVVLEVMSLRGSPDGEMSGEAVLKLVRGIFGAETDRLLATGIGIKRLEEVLTWAIGVYSGTDVSE